MSVLSDLHRLGVTEADSLLVHSSFRSLGKDCGGIAELISALRRAVCDGTLLIPALSYATVNAQNPYFDVNTTPSCIGAVPEFFRKLPDVSRSVHPTHSIAACGAYADWFTCDHQTDETPVGPHSPLAKLREKNGKILFLGCGLKPNTSMHGVEELANAPYLFLPEPVVYQCTGAGGHVRQIVCKRHNFRDGTYAYNQRYDRITEVLDAKYIRRGQAGPADCYILETAPMWEAAQKAMRREPLYFVEREYQGGHAE